NKGGSPVKPRRRGRPTLPSDPFIARCTFARLRPGAGSRHATLSHAQVPPPRGPPHAGPPTLPTPPRLPHGRALRRRPPPQGPEAQHAALPVRRTARRRPTRHLGRLPRSGEVPGDARGTLDQPEQLHPPLAGRTSEDVHGERARQKFGPRAIAPGVI